jgi:hypothetical protein
LPTSAAVSVWVALSAPMSVQVVPVWACHWWRSVPSPSMSASELVAARVWPSLAAPPTATVPVCGSFTAAMATSTVPCAVKRSSALSATV